MCNAASFHRLRKYRKILDFKQHIIAVQHLIYWTYLKGFPLKYLKTFTLNLRCLLTAYLAGEQRIYSAHHYLPMPPAASHFSCCQLRSLCLLSLAWQPLRSFTSPDILAIECLISLLLLCVSPPPHWPASSIVHTLTISPSCSLFSLCLCTATLRFCAFLEPPPPFSQPHLYSILQVFPFIWQISFASFNFLYLCMTHLVLLWDVLYTCWHTYNNTR